jgi:hypothetical protein
MLAMKTASSSQPILEKKGTDLFSSSLRSGHAASQLSPLELWSISSHSPAAMASMSLPSGQPFHQAGAVPLIFARSNDQVHMIHHQAIGIDAATIGALPFPQVFKAMPTFPICDERRLA